MLSERNHATNLAQGLGQSAIVFALAIQVAGAVSPTTTSGTPVVSHSAAADHSYVSPPSKNAGFATIVFFYTADAPEVAFFQETIKLKKAMKGYDRIVLLKHNDLPAWLDLSEADEKLADVKVAPTQANLEKYLTQLTKAGYTIDLWIVGHGTEGKFLVSAGTNGSKDWVGADEIEQMAKRNGYSKFRLRMVWSTLCYGSTLNDAWLSAGAMTVSGARFVNFYPIQFGTFAEKWTSGASYKSSVDDADTSASRTTVQTYVAMVHAPSCNKDWGKCPFGSTVLSSKDCAKDYFKTKWLHSDWQGSLSGKENMNYSSTRRFAGNTTITKSAKWSG